MDNAFLDLDDWNTAQRPANAFDVRQLHRRIDQYAARFCPVGSMFGETYHWSLMQNEYATDVVFRSAVTAALKVRDAIVLPALT